MLCLWRIRAGYNCCKKEKRPYGGPFLVWRLFVVSVFHKGVYYAFCGRRAAHNTAVRVFAAAAYADTLYYFAVKALADGDVVPEGVVIFMLHAIQRMDEIAEAGGAGLPCCS